MRILITGATGFVGQTLVPYLLHEGHEPVLLVRETYGMGTPLPPSLQAERPKLALVYADLRNFSLTARAVREAAPEVVLHLAAQGATEPFLDPHTAVRHNLTGTLNLLRAYFEQSPAPPQRLVIARTPGEQSKMNVYAASKAAAWGFCEMYACTQGWP
ncbi:MAG: NAD(P)-dependent oxidoreductase, partial [Anaerolineales bacterium]|nr:NAD(P)-dependent oxidoreductase [Anaerolineales bacterium]